MSVVNSEVMNRPFCRDITKVCECVCATESDVVNQKNAEPPRLDRSAWKCGICEVPTHWVEWGNLGYEYCPHCGRPLTDAAWETLKRRLAGREHQ